MKREWESLKEGIEEEKEMKNKYFENKEYNDALKKILDICLEKDEYRINYDPLKECGLDNYSVDAYIGRMERRIFGVA